ncbi:MAG: DUF167 domain-containing protein [Alphaproteobacteria bacterium]|jgi:uncharacterized protein (TIGR00251 family)|nr:DUF167 domain-containing protein [Candidatus Jidaibacter sp.]
MEQQTINNLKIQVKVYPGSKKQSIECLSFSGTLISLKSHIHAQPENGKANKALIDLLSDYFSVPKSKIQLHSGATSRNKVLLIAEISDKNLEHIPKQLSLC